MESSHQNCDRDSEHLGSIQSQKVSKRTSSAVAKIVRETTNLYLTRSLREANQLFESLLIPEELIDALPTTSIAKASPKDRLKAWRLYIALLDAIVDLGSEEGRRQFGHSEWDSILGKVKTTALWSDIVHTGYCGIEGSVEDVLVVELVMLFLKHASSQEQNQRHLESYLCSADGLHLPNQLTSNHEDGFPTQLNHGSGTNTPQRLSHRVKILELYALEVLPRNGEWDYAREFITMSDVLDDDTRELFLQALHDLQSQESAGKQETARSDREESLRREMDEEEVRIQQRAERQGDEVRRIPEQNREHQTNGAKDYGIDDTVEKTTTSHGSRPPKPQHQPRNSLRPSIKEISTANRKKEAKDSMIHQSSALMASIRYHLMTFARSASKNPMIMLRFVLFWIAFILTLSRRDVRDRATNALAMSWTKLRATVGMGIKVSYV